MTRWLPAALLVVAACQTTSPQVVTLTSAEALEAHVASPRGVLFINEPWSLYSEEKRLCMTELAAQWKPSDGAISLAVVDIDVPPKPSWLFAFVEKHRVPPTWSYAKGDGGIIWTSRGKVTDHEARVWPHSCAALLQRTRRQ